MKKEGIKKNPKAKRGIKKQRISEHQGTHQENS